MTMPDHPPTITVESRTIGGECFLRATAVTNALRTRADELDAAKPATTDLDDLIRTQEHVWSIGYETAARELRICADALDFGVIAHLTERADDSPVGGDA